MISRRWATKPELVRAAVEHALVRQAITVPDTGSLRDDMVALLRELEREAHRGPRRC